MKNSRKNTLFITGSTGFIGTHLLNHLDLRKFAHIYCLVRTQTPTIRKLDTHSNFHTIQADLHDSNSYGHYLAHADIVLHLAAQTGRAKPQDYFKANTEATKLLIEQSKNHKVKKLLFISSIAVKFLDMKSYYYAQSKLEAEEIVKGSGITYTILRPTIVIGRDSPIFANLSQLATYPVVPIFGDGLSKIQPIYIDDLVNCILYILDNDIFSNETIEIGGPEQITIEEFIRSIHRHLHNREPKAIHLPLKLITTILRFFERYFTSYLPLTSGQLASFNNDGVTSENFLFNLLKSNMKNVHQMLRILLTNVKHK